MTLEEQIAEYLDGVLDDRATAEVETRLVEPAVARLLGEELMLRTLLAAMPPDAPPGALVTRLENSLGVSRSVTRWARQRLGAAWRPALGASARISVTGARLAVLGVSTVRSTLDRGADRPLPRLTRRITTPWWRWAARYMGRRLT